MFNEITLMGPLGQNAERKTAENNREYVVLNLATQESWKNDKGEHERPHRVASRLRLEQSLEVRQDASERATDHARRDTPVPGDRDRTAAKQRQAEIHAT